MGAKKYVTLKELSELKDIPMWRINDLSRNGKLPLRSIAGIILKPYSVDLEKFNELEVVVYHISEKKSSLKIEKLAKTSRHRKVDLWQK